MAQHKIEIHQYSREDHMAMIRLASGNWGVRKGPRPFFWDGKDWSFVGGRNIEDFGMPFEKAMHLMETLPSIG